MRDPYHRHRHDVIVDPVDDSVLAAARAVQTCQLSLQWLAHATRIVGQCSEDELERGCC